MLARNPLGETGDLSVDYGVLRRGKVRAIMRALALGGGEASLSQLARETGIPKSTLDYNLSIIERSGLIKRKGGQVKLMLKTPICYLFDAPCNYAYIGLLGERSGRVEAETETAVKLLQEEGINPEKIVVATTYKAITEWEGVIRLDVEWLLMTEEEITNVEKVEANLQPKLEELARNYKVIADCTSATKPATIALYNQANKHKTPLIYVYEKQRKLHWITSPDNLKKQLLNQ